MFFRLLNKYYQCVNNITNFYLIKQFVEILDTNVSFVKGVVGSMVNLAIYISNINEKVQCIAGDLVVIIHLSLFTYQ